MGRAAVTLVVGFMVVCRSMFLLRLTATVFAVERHIEGAEDVGGGHERARKREHE